MLAVDDDGEVTSATSAVDLKRPLTGPLRAADLKLEHGVDLAPATEAVDLREQADLARGVPVSTGSNWCFLRCSFEFAYNFSKLILYFPGHTI